MIQFMCILLHIVTIIILPAIILIIVVVTKKRKKSHKSTVHVVNKEVINPLYDLRFDLSKLSL